MSDFDAAGELVTGALLGRAFESRAGEGQGGHAMCLNCGTALIGDHCHACGQSGHIHRSLGAIGHEILHGVAHFEGKLWRTLPLLAWRPGELTRRYIAGERARFVSPMAIFLFSIFAMFAVFQIAGISTPTDLTGPASKPRIALEQTRKKLVEQRKESIAERAGMAANDPDRAGIDRDIAENAGELRQVDQALAAFGHNNVNVTTNISGWHALDHGIEKWQENPSLMLYKLQTAVYKFSWLLIPLSLPFVWVLFFWKREYKLYDHTVFITYSIAFMSLLFIALTIAGTLGIALVPLVAVGNIVPFVHITRQLKQAYRLGWLSAIVRAVILTMFIWVVISIFLTILVLLGMLG